jgi:hypothetical protein
VEALVEVDSVLVLAGISSSARRPASCPNADGIPARAPALNGEELEE